MGGGDEESLFSLANEDELLDRLRVFIDEGLVIFRVTGDFLELKRVFSYL